MYYKFPCGCSFRILQEHSDPDVLPLLDFDIDEIDFDCKATWDLLSRGITKGVFQLESQLGKQWTKRLKPNHIENLAALGALLRPGCLRAIDEKFGCSMTELYCRRKNGEADVEYIHPCLQQVLEPTFGVLTYQEQAMEITKIVAGFNLQQADELRKAIGKKLPEEMAKVKVKYFDGANKLQLVSDDQAKEIFGWIEKSQRYSFNKSHALSYGINGYISAFLKAHFPVYFYTSWLYYAKDKQDPQQEIRELVNDAKLMDVEVLPPDIRNGETYFSTDGKLITFGLSNVKGVGEAQSDKLNKAIDAVSKLLGKHINNWTWYEFLVHLTPLVSSTVITRLISVGALRHLDSNRSKMLAEFNHWNELTKKEQEWVQVRSLNGYAKDTYNKPVEERRKGLVEEIYELIGFYDEIVENLSVKDLPTFNSLTEALEGLAPVRKDGGGTASQKRSEAVKSMVSLIKNPPSKPQDTPQWIAWNEENLLGIALTCTKVDACDTSVVNCTCKEFLAGRDGYMIFGVEINSIRTIVTKNGKSAGSKMAFLTVSDSTCAVEMIAFPQAYKEYQALLSEGNTVAIQAKRDKKNGSLIVEKVYQI